MNTQELVEELRNRSIKSKWECHEFVELDYDEVDEIIEILEKIGKPDCEHAEHDGAGCIGYGISSQDDEPIDACKNCSKYTGNVIEKKYIEILREKKDEYRPAERDSDWWYNRKTGIIDGLEIAFEAFKEAVKLE